MEKVPRVGLGTTRDTIEDVVNLGGIQFRFIDTAGLRETEDIIESIGISKAIEKAKSAKITIFIIDASQDLDDQLTQLENIKSKGIDSPIVIVNKVDLNSEIISQVKNALFISAKNKEGIDAFCNKMLEIANSSNLDQDQTLVSNNRHLQALHHALENVLKTIEGLNNGTSGDFLAMDIRQALYHIGEITGEISTDDLLDNIFSNFCIGK